MKTLKKAKEKAIREEKKFGKILRDKKFISVVMVFFKYLRQEKIIKVRFKGSSKEIEWQIYNKYKDFISIV